MCGIYLSVSIKANIFPSATSLRLLRARGPDGYGIKREVVNTTSSQTRIYLTFVSTVLSLRGCATALQPSSQDGPVLCWNGEAWRINGFRVRGSDTGTVYLLLCSLLSTEAWRKSSASDKRQALAAIILGIEGPFSFILYDPSSSMIFASRDPIGRRSLVFQTSSTGSAVLASIRDPSFSSTCEELRADGLYSIALSSTDKDCEILDVCRLDFITWAELTSRPDPYRLSQSLGSCAADLDTASGVLNVTLNDECVANCKQKLLKALQLRVNQIPQADFTGRRVIGGEGVEALSPSEKVGVLFSGGLDCTILARLCHEIRPLDEPIILINVAFQNPRLEAQISASSTPEGHHDIYEACPDRRTALSSLEELKHVCLGRKWKFLAVNIPFAETEAHTDHILSLIQPHNTEMDLSIAMALYFAARGEGVFIDGAKVRKYNTTARVLLSGLGADELFGGYTRHETAFRRGGVTGLRAEMQLDFERIGRRNLGRDDRVISNWGKEVRYPFLDDAFVQWVLSLPTQQKCAFGISQKSVDTAKQTSIDASKSLLRNLAKTLGLIHTAGEKKRAIQFGSRSAKMLSRKTRGTDVLPVP